MIMVQGKNNTSQQVLSAFFQLPPIGNSSMYCPLQRTHSCCPPANLNTLKSSTHISWEHTKTYQLVEKNLGDVSFESIESHFRHQNRALHLSRWKGGTEEDVETKWLFAEGPLLLDEAKSFFFSQTALMDTEDSYHKRWLVICSSGFL